MLYLAFKIITSKGGAEPDEKNNKNLFTVGIFLQFVNPKGILFGLTVALLLYSLTTTHIRNFLLFSLFLGIVGLLVHLVGAFWFHVPKILLKHNQLFNIIMAFIDFQCYFNCYSLAINSFWMLYPLSVYITSILYNL